MLPVGALCCDVPGAEFRAWLVQAVFRANSEQIPSELRVPSKFRANSEQLPGKFRASIPNPLFPWAFCATNLLG